MWASIFMPMNVIYWTMLRMEKWFKNTVRKWLWPSSTEPRALVLLRLSFFFFLFSFILFLLLLRLLLLLLLLHLHFYRLVCCFFWQWLKNATSYMVYKCWTQYIDIIQKSTLASKHISLFMTRCIFIKYNGIKSARKSIYKCERHIQDACYPQLCL